MRATRESAICNQSDVFLQTHANDCRSRRQHLRHARTALWSLEPNDDDITFLNLLVLKTTEHVFFRVVTPCWSGESQSFLARDFGDRTIRAEIAPHDPDVSRFFDGRFNRPDDVLPVGQSIQFGQILSQSPAGHCHAVTLEKTFFQQVLLHCRCPAHLMQVVHHILAARLKVSDERNAVAD